MYLIMITSASPLPRNRHLNLLLQYRPELPNEADVCYSLLHNDGYGLRSPIPALINCILQRLDGNTIPPAPLIIRP